MLSARYVTKAAQTSIKLAVVATFISMKALFFFPPVMPHQIFASFLIFTVLENPLITSAVVSKVSMSQNLDGVFGSREKRFSSSLKCKYSRNKPMFTAK